VKYPETLHEHVWWAPDRASWWIGVLFAVGSTCFLVGPIPGFVEIVGSTVDGLVFFVGSIFFTSAAAVQYVESGFFRPRVLDWWSSAVQLVGTVFFNISTFQARPEAHAIWRANLFTSLGALGFLIGALLLLPEGANDGSPASDDARHSTDREPQATQKRRSPR
jgi:hypothetical protein